MKEKEDKWIKKSWMIEKGKWVDEEKKKRKKYRKEENRWRQKQKKMQYKENLDGRKKKTSCEIRKKKETKNE